MDYQRIVIEKDGTRKPIGEYLATEGGRAELLNIIREMIDGLNQSYSYDRSLAQDWLNYLSLLAKGYEHHLSNPYADLEHYDVQTVTLDNWHSMTNLRMIPWVPATRLEPTRAEFRETLQKTLFILALGGIDTTFYKGMKPDAQFVREFFTPKLYDIFHKYGAKEIIPRGFAGKRDQNGRPVTNAESMILQAYRAGIRNVAVIANSRTYRAAQEYLNWALQEYEDLHVVVIPQPFLPSLRLSSGSKELVLSKANSAYPGGHGHGFKYCLLDQKVAQRVRQAGLEYFIFSNGDNTVLFNWGGNHFAWALQEFERQGREKDFDNLRIAFFLVWERLRKGGFVFQLTRRDTGQRSVQVIEVELARQSGADIDKLKYQSGGYNTNVAIGLIEQARRHLQNLPMALKIKDHGDAKDFLFEASLGTAMTTRQDDSGRSSFDANAMITFLAPEKARYQHWSHLAIRKRDDFFAFHSSLFRVGDVGGMRLIYSDRDATQKYPTLEGNFIDPQVLNSRQFFELLKDAELDVDDFYGTLHIDLLGDGKQRGHLSFRGKIKLVGRGKIEIIVPAGEKMIIADRTIFSHEKEGSKE